MNFEWSDAFRKDVARLVRKYKSIPDDVEVFCRVLLARQPDTRRKNDALLVRSGSVSIWKTRLFCQYLKGDALRVVFAYHEGGVEFLELFYKGDKEREDESRYQHYLEAVH